MFSRLLLRITDQYTATITCLTVTCIVLNEFLLLFQFLKEVTNAVCDKTIDQPTTQMVRDNVLITQGPLVSYRSFKHGKTSARAIAESEFRAVKKFFNSRLIMNSRRLWNSHQRRTFLRVEASRDIVKFRISEIASPGVFNRYFPPRTPCCFVGIHARLEAMPSKCPRPSTTSHGSNVSQV